MKEKNDISVILSLVDEKNGNTVKCKTSLDIIEEVKELHNINTLDLLLRQLIEEIEKFK